MFLVPAAHTPCSRVPGAAQHEVVRCSPGTVTVCGGPGSAVHRFATATRCTASGTQLTLYPQPRHCRA
jgi:hypothetical protein